MKCHSGKIKDGGKCICRTESSFAGNLQISTEKCSRLSQTDNPAIMSSISKFFIEVEAAVGLLEEKYHDQSRNRGTTASWYTVNGHKCIEEDR